MNLIIDRKLRRGKGYYLYLWYCKLCEESEIEAMSLDEFLKIIKEKQMWELRANPKYKRPKNVN